MVRFRSLLICALVLSAPFTSAASTDSASLSIRVTNPEGTPIAGVRITVRQVQEFEARQVLTGSDGRAIVDALPPGSYLLDAATAGLSLPSALRISLASSEAREIELRLSAVTFEAHVVVTASGTPERRDDLTKSVSIVTATDLEARGVLTAADAIQSVPGARVQTLGGPGSQTSIQLRGLRAQDTAVLIDGVPVRDLSATQGDATSLISDLIPTDIDRIEVLRGPAADVYGSNAIAGAVNIIGRDGVLPGGAASLEGGSLGLLRAQAQSGDTLGNGRLRYTAGVSGFNVADGIDGSDRAWNISGSLRASASVGSSFVTGSFRRARAFTALNASPVGIGASFLPSADDPDSTRQSASTVTTVGVASQMRAHLSLSAGYDSVATSRTYLDGPLGPGFQPPGVSRSEFDGRADSLHARASVDTSTDNSIAISYMAQREQYVSRATPPGSGQSSSVDVVEWSQTMVLQNRLQLLDGAVRLAGAARVELFSLRTPQFAPPATAPYQDVQFQSPPSAVTVDGSAAYLISSTATKLRSHFGTGYREPSLYERFGTSFGSRGYSTYGDPRLDSEHSVGGDVGVEQAVWGHRLELSLGGFSTRLADVIVFDTSGAMSPATDPFGRSIGYRMVSGGRASGVEASLRASTRRMTVKGAYTWTATSSSDGPSAPSLSYGLPAQQGSIETFVRVTERVQCVAVVRLASSYLAPIPDAITFVSRTYRFDGMRQADFDGHYRLPLAGRRALRVSLRLNNATNQTYFESGFRTPGRTGAAGVGLEF